MLPRNVPNATVTGDFGVSKYQGCCPAEPRKGVGTSLRPVPGAESLGGEVSPCSLFKLQSPAAPHTEEWKVLRRPEISRFVHLGQVGGS